MYLCIVIRTDMAKFDLLMLDEARAFVLGLPLAAKKKVLFNVHRVADGEQNAELFKKLEGSDIWEFRTLFNKKKYRVLAFWDKEGPVDTLVIATHGFIKKTQKTPQKEVSKAISIRELYFKNKKNKKI